MASATGIRATWERQGLYIGGNQAAFGTTFEGAFTRYKEGSNVVPAGTYAPRQDLGPLSSGDSFSNLTNVLVGRKLPALSVSGVPATSMNINDMASLFLQNSYTGTTFQAYDNTHALQAKAGVPQALKWATVNTKLDTDTSVSSVFQMTGAVPRTLNITIPATSPGDSGGLVTWSSDFIGYDTSREDSVTMASSPDDTSARLMTENCIFDIGSDTGVNLVSAQINMTNNASLIMDSDDPSSGVVLGPLNIGGTITVLDESYVDGTSEYELFYNLAQTTATTTYLKFLWTSTVTIQIYVTITSVSQPQDIGGAVAWTFDWIMAQTSTTNPLAIHGEDTCATAMFYEAY